MNYSPLFQSFFIIKEIYAERQRGSDGHFFVMEHPRPTDALLLLTDTTAMYRQERKEPLYVPHGALVYIPRGSTYSVENHCVNQNQEVRAMLFEFELQKLDIVSKTRPALGSCDMSEGYFSLGTNEITVLDLRPRLYESLFSSLVDRYQDCIKGQTSVISVYRAAYAIFDLLLKNQYLTAANHASAANVVEAAINYLAVIGEGERSVAQIAELCCVSISSLEKTFRKATGMSPVEYRMECKMMKAKNMLEDRNLSILQISAELGFCDSSYFCRKFKKVVGVSPTKFRSL